MVEDVQESLERQWREGAVECERKVKEAVNKIVELVKGSAVQELKREAEGLYRMRKEALELYWLSYDEDLFILAGELAEFIKMAEGLAGFSEGVGNVDSFGA